METCLREPIWSTLFSIFHQFDLQPLGILRSVVHLLTGSNAFPGILTSAQINDHYKFSTFNTLSYIHTLFQNMAMMMKIILINFKDFSVGGQEFNLFSAICLAGTTCGQCAGAKKPLFKKISSGAIAHDHSCLSSPELQMLLLFLLP